MAGMLIGAGCVIWSLGGHISAFQWWLGAAGERDTAREIEGLGSDWHCMHDLEHDGGNWAHVLLGPPGVFLLDSKRLNRRAVAGGDALRAGRLSFTGGTFRRSAKRVNSELQRRLGRRAPFVRAVAVIWGDFPQGRYEEEEVVYLRGE